MMALPLAQEKAVERNRFSRSEFWKPAKAATEIFGSALGGRGRRQVAFRRADVRAVAQGFRRQGQQLADLGLRQVGGSFQRLQQRARLGRDEGLQAMAGGGQLALQRRQLGLGGFSLGAGAGDVIAGADALPEQLFRQRQRVPLGIQVGVRDA